MKEKKKGRLKQYVGDVKLLASLAKGMRDTGFMKHSIKKGEEIK